jgi:hypothetical protein
VPVPPSPSLSVAPGVLYWSLDTPNSVERRQVYILGNSVVSWFCLAAVAVFCVAGLLSLRYPEWFVGKRGLLSAGRCVARGPCGQLGWGAWWADEGL